MSPETRNCQVKARYGDLCASQYAKYGTDPDYLRPATVHGLIAIVAVRPGETLWFRHNMILVDQIEWRPVNDDTAQPRKEITIWVQ